MQKLLIIANNCLSHSNSNGRTLLNMLGDFTSDSLCQIYTSGEAIEGGCCSSTLRITNADVIRSYFGKKAEIHKEIVDGRNDGVNNGGAKNSVKKTALTMLLRDLAWDHAKGIHRHVIEWAKEQHPDAVILQLGDSSLLITLAMRISKILSIPLMTYNTEDYYFKQYDYMKRSYRAGFVYRRFHNRFCRIFKAMMHDASICIYNCEGLKELYEKEFGTTGYVIYGSTGIKTVEHVVERGLILYAGNLGVGRHKSLMEIGEALSQIDSTLHIDVYGAAEEQVINELENAQGIQYHGVVSYDAVCELIRKSRLLVHVESFDEFIAMDTRYAFSTKLADCLASGVPTFLYGPTTGEGIHYITNYSAAFAVVQKSMLKTELEKALYDKDCRTLMRQKALLLAIEHHDMVKNSKRFKALVELVCERQKNEE